MAVAWLAMKARLASAIENINVYMAMWRDASWLMARRLAWLIWLWLMQCLAAGPAGCVQLKLNMSFESYSALLSAYL